METFCQFSSLHPGFLLVHHGIVIPGSCLTSARKSQGLGDHAAPGRSYITAVGLQWRRLPTVRSKPDSCLSCWQHPLGFYPLAQLSASSVSGQEQQALSHYKCLLEMEQPGLVAAASMLTARASQRLRVSRFIGGMERATHKMASLGEPGSASHTGKICAPYLGNRT